MSSYGQSTESKSVNISIKIVKNSDEKNIGQNNRLNEIILNTGNINKSIRIPRDLIINFSDYSPSKPVEESVLLERGINSERIKINFDKQICIRNVVKNEKIKIIPTEFNSTLARYNKSTLTIIY